MRYTRQRIAAAALVACAMLAGCTSTPAIRSDYDKTADFGKYHTFGFIDHTDAKSLVIQTLETAATREMEARGYTVSDKPDLVVNFTGKLEDRTDVQSVPGPYYGPAWGYGGWYGAPYGAYAYNNTQVTTRHYKVGQLVMDIVDREKRQVVFQAGLERTVTKEMQQNRDQALTKAVGLLFGSYPFVAGQAAPVAPAEKK